MAVGREGDGGGARVSDFFLLLSEGLDVPILHDALL